MLAGPGSSREPLVPIVNRIDPAEAERITQSLSAAILLEKDGVTRFKLARSLISVAEGVQPSRVARLLIDFMKVEKDAIVPQILADSQEALWRRMSPSDASTLGDTSAQVLISALEREKDLSTRQQMFSSLEKLASRLSLSEAPNVYDRVVEILNEDLAREKDQEALRRLATAVAGFSGLMNRSTADHQFRPAANVLVEAIEKVKDAEARRSFALDLTKVASRMSPAEAERICGRAAKVLIAAIAKEAQDAARLTLASALACVAVRITPDEAVNAVRIVIQTAARQASDSFKLHELYYLLSGQPTPPDASRAARIIISVLEQEKDDNARWCLAAGLALVITRMEPGEAVRIYSPTLTILASALLNKEDSQNIFLIAIKLLSRGDSGPIIETGRALTIMLAKPESDVSRRYSLVNSLESIADRLPAEEAATTAHVMVAELARDSPAFVRDRLIQALSLLSSRVTANEATKIGKQLAASFSHVQDDDTRISLARSLAVYAGRMTPDEANNVCGEAARVLAEAIEADPSAPISLVSLQVRGIGMGYSGGRPYLERSLAASSLASLADSMEPAVANRLCRQAIRVLLKKLHSADASMVLLLPQLDPATSRALAWECAMQICSDNKASSIALERVITLVERHRPASKQVVSSTGTGGPPNNPPPCSLTTQELVELLKMPTCCGAARRVVLDQLGNIHGRRFVNHWAFVRFAREKGLDVHLTTPPRRPDRQESIRRMLAILDGKL